MLTEQRDCVTEQTCVNREQQNCIQMSRKWHREMKTHYKNELKYVYPFTENYRGHFRASLIMVTCQSNTIIIRLDARLQPNMDSFYFTARFRGVHAATRSAITPTKVNRYGLNLEHSEYIVGGWLLHILGAEEPGKI